MHGSALEQVVLSHGVQLLQGLTFIRTTVVLRLRHLRMSCTCLYASAGRMDVATEHVQHGNLCERLLVAVHHSLLLSNTSQRMKCEISAASNLKDGNPPTKPSWSSSQQRPASKYASSSTQHRTGLDCCQPTAHQSLRRPRLRVGLQTLAGSCLPCTLGKWVNDKGDLVCKPAACHIICSSL